VGVQIEEISLSEFDLSLVEMRIMNMSRILQVEQSMRVHGQLQPVIARVHEGGIQLIDGYKRLYAAEDLMMDTLECRLLEVDLDQAKVLLLSYNWTGQSLAPYEEAVVLKDLLETHHIDQRRLAKLTGKSTSWVSRRLSLIGKLDEGVCTEIRMGSLSSSHARALMRLPRGNQAAVARVISLYKLTSREAEKLVDAFLEASDEQDQGAILDYPERGLLTGAARRVEYLYDDRLSGYGNELSRMVGGVVESMQLLLRLSGDQRFGTLTEIERMVLFPGFEVITDGMGVLKEDIDKLQIDKSLQQDER
jgi:ParB family chromosome partitioning protein